MSCSSHNSLAGHPVRRRSSSLSLTRYARSSRLASRAPRCATYATNYGLRTLGSLCTSRGRRIFRRCRSSSYGRSPPRSAMGASRVLSGQPQLAAFAYCHDPHSLGGHTRRESRSSDQRGRPCDGLLQRAVICCGQKMEKILHSFRPVQRLPGPSVTRRAGFPLA